MRDNWFEGKTFKEGPYADDEDEMEDEDEGRKQDYMGEELSDGYK